MSQMQKLNLVEKVLVESFSNWDLSDNDFFLLFCLLYYYELRTLAHIEVGGYSQRGASEILALLWRAINSKDRIPDKKKEPESHYVHWYWKWNADWNGDEHFQNLSSSENVRLEEFKERILKHGLIESVLLVSDRQTYNELDGP